MKQKRFFFHENTVLECVNASKNKTVFVAEIARWKCVNASKNKGVLFFAEIA